MGPNKKKFKTTCHLTFLEKKSFDLLPIKVKTKNQDQSPPSKKSQTSQHYAGEVPSPA